MGCQGIEPCSPRLKGGCITILPTTQKYNTALVGIEPTTIKLTACCSTIKLQGILVGSAEIKREERNAPQASKSVLITYYF